MPKIRTAAIDASDGDIECQLLLHNRNKDVRPPDKFRDNYARY
jgi:hypothetical protein